MLAVLGHDGTVLGYSAWFRAAQTLNWFTLKHGRGQFEGEWPGPIIPEDFLALIVSSRVHMLASCMLIGPHVRLVRLSGHPRRRSACIAHRRAVTSSGAVRHTMVAGSKGSYSFWKYCESIDCGGHMA